MEKLPEISVKQLVRICGAGKGFCAARRRLAAISSRQSA
jgi:hypothetical protein